MPHQFEQPFRHLSDAERTQYLDRCRAEMDAGAPLWVFGYGSLLWRPCYAIARSCVTTLRGYRRALCIWTIEARGTPASPGLGLGLLRDEDSRCAGHAHCINPASQADALVALWEREMLTGIYLPTWVEVEVDGHPISALTFVVDSKHPQFAGDLAFSQQVEFIANASGVLGSNAEYLRSTVAALQSVQITDDTLESVDAAVQRHLSARP